MITQFDTSKVSRKKGGGGNQLLLILVVAVGGFLIYRYVIKPRLDAKKDEDDS